MPVSSSESGNVNTPETGYILEKVYSPKLYFEGFPVSEEMPSEDEVSIALGWDWRIVSESAFEVVLVVGFNPTKKRPERAEVVTIGRFSLRGSVQSLEVLKFVRAGAPAILFPYTREILSSLTGRGLSGAFQLNPLNILEALKRFDEGSTTAARQLRENPSLISVLGTSKPEVLTSPERELRGHD